ncbi:hypothetical protein PENTCL1PPCAC_22067, partial [Pristionchus entomophagus]
KRLPVMKSRDGVLRYVYGTRWEQTSYFLVVRIAVLPRCPRLKKRIIYACNSNNEIIGNIMIIYSYNEDGPIPQPAPRFSAAVDSLLRRKRAGGGGDDYDGYTYDVTTESGEPYIDVVADEPIEVRHSEEIASSPAPGRRTRGLLSGRGVGMGMQPRHQAEVKRRQRIMEFIQSQAGPYGKEEIVDCLWSLALETSRSKVISNIRRDFGVEIVTNDFGTEEMEGQEEHHHEDEVVEDGQMGKSDTVVDVGGGERVVEETVEDSPVEEAPVDPIA